MTYDPLTEVTDEFLQIDASVLQSLAGFRDQDKLVSLPGQNTEAERARLSAGLNQLANELIEGVEANPNKRWVMSRFQYYLKKVQQEDTEAREHFGVELEAIMDILGIESSDGLLNYYLVGL